jgi:hypothetical protein
VSAPGRLVGGGRDGAAFDLPPHLARPGAIVRLPMMRAPWCVPEWWPLGLDTDEGLEVVEYVVEGWVEPSDAAPRYLELRPKP